MKNLEEWVVMKEAASTSTGEGGGDIIIKRENMFPSLKKLTIYECPKLRSVQPGLPLSVVDILIRSSMDEEVVWGSCSLGGLSKLKRLSISGIEANVLESSSFPEGLQCLTSLEQLQIFSCVELTSLPEGLIQLHIPTLRSLRLIGNVKLTCLGGYEEQMPPLLFTSLHRLDIEGCSEMSALPEWVGCLTSLQSLLIFFCPKMEMLPDGVQRLTSLDRLEIMGYPILRRRCKRDTGEDWHNISHIPHLYIYISKEEEEENRNDGRTTTIRRASDSFTKLCCLR